MRLLNFDGHAWWDSPGDSSTSVCAIPIVLSEDMSNVRRAGGATGGAQRFACRDRVVCLNDSVIDRFQCRSTKLSHAQLVRSPCTGDPHRPLGHRAGTPRQALYFTTHVSHTSVITLHSCSCCSSSVRRSQIIEYIHSIFSEAEGTNIIVNI